MVMDKWKSFTSPPPKQASNKHAADEARKITNNPFPRLENQNKNQSDLIQYPVIGLQIFYI